MAIVGNGISKASEFKARFEKGVEVILPASGLTVRLRGIGFDYLIKHGKVPDTLTEVVAGQLSALLTSPDVPAQETTLESKVLSYVEFINSVAMEAIVEPPGLDPDWLEFDDKQFIIKVLHMPVQELANNSFRLHSERMESLRDEPAIDDTPLTDYGDQNVGAGKIRP